LYYDQTHTDWQYDVAMEARRVTAAWSESSATWSNMAGNIAAQPAGNMVTADDGDAGTSVSGTWPYSTNPTLTPKAINGDYRYNSDATAGNTHTWVPTITESGDYQVEVHFTTESDRPTNAPYTVYYVGGSKLGLRPRSITGGELSAALAGFRLAGPAAESEAKASAGQHDPPRQGDSDGRAAECLRTPGYAACMRSRCRCR
jgi:hypothetical protein